MSIEVTEVSRFFGRFPAVQQLSLTVPSGSVTGLVGPNGAGKTTLLLMLAALLAPDSGTIRIAGLDPVAQPQEVHRAVGWMPDAFGTWDSLTCTEILLTFADAQQMDRAASRQAAGRMLAAVHLQEMAHQPARVLSRGQKQRLGLARALIHRPRVLLLDEPASGMDPRSRADLRALLRDLAGAGTTILISSHILGELEEMVDGAVFMARGQALGGPVAVEPAPAASTVPPGAPPPSGAPGQAPPPGSPRPIGPMPVRRTWRLRALDGEQAAQWARQAGLALTAVGPDGLRLTVSDDAAAARILRQAVEAGIDVVSFGPLTGALEEAYLAMEGERR
ncbi:ATP-binding cassette domain-containing protein [Actinomyces bowdenii]|uniref:ABC transporter ATP-binding protein n=1 Tax=Actinomyces bowdenii TaxID=131109 RepID=UPI001ABC6A29|nr:ABC transporter ATP-binding protein [Actinomyces bowdenii]MBO3723612.1 ATP-binding cassette domain-containing protein [Actinomyces bowdenii]